MNREDAKDLTLSILAVVVPLLLADCIWLHAKCARQSAELASLSGRLERHLNPPRPNSERSLADKAKQTYDKVKSAAAKGYQAAKEELGR